MLVNLVANELVDGEIEFVSLVKNGANRSPFKIVKMEELPKESAMGSLKDKLNVMFGKDAPDVAAFFVKTDKMDLYKERIEAFGFNVQDAEELSNGVTIFKQEGFDAEADATMVALNDSLGLAFDQVIKDFSPMVGSSDFGETAGATAFFPGLHHAMEALAESIWNSLNTAADKEVASSQIDKNLSAFRKHINSLVKNMPPTVIKLEYECLKDLAKHIEGSTVEVDSSSLVKSEDGNMGQIAEAMAGDLAGLNDVEEQDKDALAKAEAAAKDEEVTSEEPAAEETVEKETTAEAAATAEIVFLDEDGNEISEEDFEKLCSGGKKGKKMSKDADGNLTPFEETVEEEPEVEKEEDVAVPSFDASTLAEPLNLIGKALNEQSKTLAKIEEGLAKQADRLEQLEKTSQEAITKAEEITLVDHGYDLDESLATVNSHRPVSETVQKRETTDIFKGLCPELDALEEQFRSQS